MTTEHPSKPQQADWRQDLIHSRDLTRTEIDGFGFKATRHRLSYSRRILGRSIAHRYSMTPCHLKHSDYSKAVTRMSSKRRFKRVTKSLEEAKTQVSTSFKSKSPNKAREALRATPSANILTATDT